MTQRVIVIDTLDTHFRAIAEIGDLESFAFSSPALAIEAGRVLLPHAFVVGREIGTSEINRFVHAVRACEPLASVPILLLLDDPSQLDQTLASDRLTRCVDGSELGEQLRGVLDVDRAVHAFDAAGLDARRAERHAEHCDSLSRIALMQSVDDERFLLAVLAEGCASLRPEVRFSATLLRLEDGDWVVEASFEPDEATVSLPGRDTRMPLSDDTVQRVLGAGTTLIARGEDAGQVCAGVAGAWRAVAAAPIVFGTSVYLLFFAAGRLPRDPFDAHDRSYVDTLASLCGARLRQRQQLAALRFNAEHDALTGILNRGAFRARGIAAMREAAAQRGQTALAVLDLVHFDEVNASLGRQKGDALLVEVAAALGALAGTDVVARLGGDAFGILMADVRDAEDVEARISRYAARFAEPFSTGDRDGVEQERLQTRIGIACAPSDGETFEVLLAHADTARLAARTGRAAWSFFDPAVQAKLMFTHALRADLAAANIETDFRLFYQPIVDLGTTEIVGAEALIRWAHPDRGMLLPAEFLSFAEEQGLLPSIGDWVIRGAAAAAVQLREVDPAIRVWLNLSATELADPKIVAQLAEYGSLQRALGVEVRQNTAVEDLEATITMLAVLKRAGVSIALDDFGSGNWPLTELKRLPIDVLKLDPSLTASLPHDERDREIVDLLLQLGDRFGFAVVAKGIERMEQARWLRAAGCDSGQGYLLGHPMTLPELEAMLRERNNSPYEPRIQSLSDRYERHVPLTATAKRSA